MNRFVNNITKVLEFVKIKYLLFRFLLSHICILGISYLVGGTKQTLDISIVLKVSK